MGIDKGGYSRFMGREKPMEARVIIVSGKATVSEGALDKVRDIMEETIRETRNEAGCIDYSYGVDVLQPDTILIVEYWENWEALEKHFTQPHMAKWMKTLGEVGVLSRNIRFIEAGEERNPLG